MKLFSDLFDLPSDSIAGVQNTELAEKADIVEDSSSSVFVAGSTPDSCTDESEEESALSSRSLLVVTGDGMKESDRMKTSSLLKEVPEEDN